MSKKELNKDDLYELEKICDVYSGWISENVHKYCQTAFNLSAVKDHKTPLDDIILDLDTSRKRIKELRDKLEAIRKQEEPISNTCRETRAEC